MLDSACFSIMGHEHLSASNNHTPQPLFNTTVGVLSRKQPCYTQTKIYSLNTKLTIYSNFSIKSIHFWDPCVNLLNPKSCYNEQCYQVVVVHFSIQSFTNCFCCCFSYSLMMLRNLIGFLTSFSQLLFSS